MPISGVKRKLFKRIAYDGKIYKRTDIPVIGGIAECLRSDAWTTKGKFYLIGEYTDVGSPSVIVDDRYFYYYS